MEQNVYKSLFEKVCNENNETAEMIMSLAFVNCISSDSLFTVEDCDKSLEILQCMKDGLAQSNLKDTFRKEWEERLDDAFSIVNRDKNKLM